MNLQAAKKRRAQQPILWVKAAEHSAIREVDETGKPLMNMRFVGYDLQNNIMEEGVKLPYMVHYISHLKQGSLIAMDVQTAQLAGVPMQFPKAKGEASRLTLTFDKGNK